MEESQEETEAIALDRLEAGSRSETAFVELLGEISAAANRSTGIEEAFQVSLDKVCALTGWPIGHVYLVDEDGGGLTSSGIWHLDGTADLEAFRDITTTTPLSAGKGLPGRVLKSKEAAWIEDVTKDDNFPRLAKLRDVGVRGAFAFPVAVGGDVLGVLEFFSRHSHPRHDRLLAAMGQIGLHLGEVLLRERSRTDLQASEARFRAVSEAAVDAIVSADASSRIVYFNAGAERMFGYPAQEAMGQSLTILMPEELRPLHLKAFERYLRTGEARVIGRTVELQGRRKDGTMFPLELSLAAWNVGDEPRFTGILRDITERRFAHARLEEALESERDLRRRAEELNAEFESFIYTVTHDLKNPLVAIIGFAELLMGEFKDDPQSRGRMLAERVIANGHYMQELIADLLELSRVGRTQTEKSAIDMESLVRSVHTELAGAYPGLQVAVGKLPVVFMNPTRARQLMTNLLGNSAAHGGRDDIEVTVTSIPAGAGVELSISDNGVGVPAQDRERAFGVFERLTDRANGGTGIGLAVCRKIVQSVEGRIWIGGSPEGCDVRISLPDEAISTTS